MRVAWVTPRDLEAVRDDVVDAELAMIRRRPADVSEVLTVMPGGVAKDLADYDRIVVNGIEGFSSRELNMLAHMNVILWEHDSHALSHWFQLRVKRIIFLNELHRKFETEKVPQLSTMDSFLCPGYINREGLTPDRPKLNYALWIHYPSAGLDGEARWAWEQKIELRVMVNRGEEEVARALNEAKYFIMLAADFEPGPEIVLKAQLAGCNLVLDNVGYIGLEPPELSVMLSEADKQFWECVLS